MHTKLDIYVFITFIKYDHSQKIGKAKCVKSVYGQEEEIDDTKVGNQNP